MREPGDAVRRACARLCLLRRRAGPRHLRQYEDGGDERVRRQGAGLQPALLDHDRPLYDRADRLLAGGGMGEGPGREPGADDPGPLLPTPVRSEEHTSELQSLMRISYAVFCLKKTTN